MYCDITNEINKGIPSKREIVLCNFELLSLCANEYNANVRLLDLRQGLFDKISDLLELNNFTYSIGEIPYYKIVTSDNLKSYLRYDFDSHLRHDLIYFNIPFDEREFSQLSSTEKIKKYQKALLQKSKELLYIKKEKDLKKKFPYIYECYFFEGEYNEDFVKINELKKTNLDDYFKEMDKFLTFQHKSYKDFVKRIKCYSLTNYIKDIVYVKTKELTNIDEILRLYDSYELEIGIDIKITQKKFDLFLAYKYLTKAEMSESLDEVMEYCYFLSSYFNYDANPNNLKIKITDIDAYYKDNVSAVRAYSFGSKLTITKEDVYKRYRKLLLKYPELYFLDFKRSDFNDMTLDEVAMFLKEYFNDLNVNWNFFRADEEYLDKKQVNEKNDNYHQSDNSILSLNKKDQLQERKLELFMAKKKFFDNTDPYLLLKGKNTFDGYIGYLYKNGVVVLEKYYDSVSTGSASYGNAIYVMNINEFYEITHASKVAIIRDNLCTRIIHQGNWEKRVLDEINKKGTCNPIEEVKKLQRKKD